PLPVAPVPEPIPVAATPEVPTPLQPIEEEFILDVPDDLVPAAEVKAPVLEVPQIQVEQQPLTPLPPVVPPPVAAAAQAIVASPVAPTAPPTPVAVPEKATEDILGDFVLDLEQTLGDFIPEPETPALLDADDDPLGIAPPPLPPPKLAVTLAPVPKIAAAQTP